MGWLLAYQGYGEGVFISLNPKEVERWLKRKSVIREAAEMGLEDPAYVLVHTFSHFLKCRGTPSFILIKCADIAVLVCVFVAAGAAGCGSAGAARAQGLMSTAAQVRGRLVYYS